MSPTRFYSNSLRSVVFRELLTQIADSDNSVNESRYFINSLNSVFRFIKEEQVPHCAPDSVATGLGSLPLAYVFVNGSQTNTKTTQELPTGEKLNGKDSYKRLLAHFTTTSQTPDEIYNLGKDMRDKLYSEV